MRECGHIITFNPAVGERFNLVLRSDESYDEMTEKVKRYIDYDTAFDIYAWHIDLDEGIEPGTYTFEEGMTVIEVARTLKFGSDNSVNLVINNARTPEALAGKIAMQIDADSVSMLAALRSETLMEEFGFDSAEAMFSIFLPNTYEVYADVEPEALVRRLKSESDKFWSDEARVAALERSGLTPYGLWCWPLSCMRRPMQRMRWRVLRAYISTVWSAVCYFRPIPH